MKLRKMKRGEFESGRDGKAGHYDVLAVTALAQLALDHGVSPDVVRATLDAHRMSWPTEVVRNLIDAAEAKP